MDWLMREIRHPTFVQSILGEFWATALFLFFLILSVMPGFDGNAQYVAKTDFVFRSVCGKLFSAGKRSFILAPGVLLLPMAGSRSRAA
jgi:hypothetical protein